MFKSLNDAADVMLELDDGQGDDSVDLKVVFVAPSPRELPNDGFMSFDVMVDIYSFRAQPERTCVLVPEEGFVALSVICDNPSIFGVRLVRLEGLPGADYSVAWDSVTYALERISYNALVSEMSMVLEAESALAASKMSIHDKEKAQYTRNNGTVKDNTNFELADDEDGE